MEISGDSALFFRKYSKFMEQTSKKLQTQDKNGKIGWTYHSKGLTCPCERWCIVLQVQWDMLLDVCSVLCLCLFACVWIIIPLSVLLRPRCWKLLIELLLCGDGADQSIKYNQCNVWSVSSDTDNTDTDTHQYIHTTRASVKARAGNEPSRSLKFDHHNFKL